MIKFKASKNENLVSSLVEGTRLPFSVVNKKLREKQVMVNGVRTKDNISVLVGDEICVFAEEVKVRLDIVYEDENIAVFVKPKGIETKDFQKDIVKQTKKTYIMCHRLDRNTEGLVIFAKSPVVEKEFFDAFIKEQVIKTYYAKVFGRPADKAILKGYLKKNSEKSTVMIFERKVEGSDEIVTEYKKIKQNGEMYILEVILKRGGKTHQVRAHLASVGLPLVGDSKYGNSELNKKYKIKQQELYAVKLNFKLTGRLSYLNDNEIKYEPRI